MNPVKMETMPPANRPPKREQTPMMNLSKLNLEYSPIVEKFRNCLQLTTRSDNAKESIANPRGDMILISPRILLSAQKQQLQQKNQHKIQKSDLQKRPSPLYVGDTCRKKRRKKSSIGGSCSSSSDRKMSNMRGRSFEYQDDDVEEGGGIPFNLRGAGMASKSFKGDQESAHKSQGIKMNLSQYYFGENSHIISTSNSSKLND